MSAIIVVCMIFDIDPSCAGWPQENITAVHRGLFIVAVTVMSCCPLSPQEFGLSQLREGAASHSLRAILSVLTLLFYHTYVSLILGETPSRPPRGVPLTARFARPLLFPHKSCSPAGERNANESILINILILIFLI